MSVGTVSLILWALTGGLYFYKYVLGFEHHYKTVNGILFVCFMCGPCVWALLVLLTIGSGLVAMQEFFKDLVDR